MKVVIIGSGNVATVLGKMIREAGNSVEQVISRSMQGAVKLASLVEARPENNLAAIYKHADLYIVAVPDDEIEQVARHTELNNNVVVHTAGSVAIEVLKPLSSRYGIIYPLQSLKKELSYSPQIPVIIDGSSDDVTDFLYDFVSSWAGQVSVAGDDERLKIHLAAVMASNFTNHLYTLAEDYCKTQALNFDLLVPLIKETANRVGNLSPRDVQTGPAVRGDAETIRKHLNLLNPYPSNKDLYKLLTESIMRYHNCEIKV